MQANTYIHETVLLHEAVEGLRVAGSGIYVDATYGGGGHTRAILAQLGAEGRVIAFDQDRAAWESNINNDSRLVQVTENFRYMKRFLRLHNINQVDGILADLGVSSHQFDTAERGFSVRFDGPLDMRMDNRLERNAADIIATYSETRLHQVFELYGEVRNARELARHIAANRKASQIKTINGFKAMIDPVMKGSPMKYLAQVFQALRIEVNEELDVLKDLLLQSAQCLRPGGRLCVISFHSLEDRIVKQFVKRGSWNEDDDNTIIPAFRQITAKPVEAGEAELKRNPRARSARLRIAEKL